MTTKEILLKQMAACHDEESWFVPMTKALSGLTAEQAAWKDSSTNNSIWENVNHLIFWNDRYLLRFNEFETLKFDGNNDSTFKGKKATGTEEDWNSTVEKLYTALSEWQAALNKASEDKLNSDYSESGSWYSIIADITAHNAYHLGQIVHTRKLQGSWTPSGQ